MGRMAHGDGDERRGKLFLNLLAGRSDPQVAPPPPDVTMPRRLSTLLVFFAIAACGGSSTAPTPPQTAVASVIISPTTASVQVGQSVPLAATALDASGGPLTGRTVVWSSNPQSVATVENGVVTGVSEGVATITATSEGKSGTAQVTVTPIPVDAVVVSPLTANVQVGQTVALSAETRSAAGGVLIGRTVTWSSNPEGVATVANGVVLGVSSGVATITATSEGKSGTAQVTVLPIPVATVLVTPPTAQIEVGATVALAAETRDGTGGVLIGRTVTWSSNAEGVATVLNGVVTGVAAGVATITATSEGVGGSSEVTVTTPFPPLGIGFGDEQFAFLPGGTFLMGTPGGGDGDEVPTRNVTLNQFAMQKTEVTQAQWRQVMQGTGMEEPSAFPGCDLCPVEQVSWEDIQEFLTRLNQQTGHFHRLPREAEWEFAARAGTLGDYGGTGVLNDMGWWSGNSTGRPWPVAQKLPNAWGIYDMHGNVWEWNHDWYGPYPAGDVTSPIGPLSGSARVRRGGSWSGSENSARSGNRGSGTPTTRADDRGFRVIRVTIS